MTHRRAFALLALIVLLIAGLLLIFQLQLFKLRSPGAPHSQNNLNGVAAVSANDIWAVGYYGQASGANQTLIEHWDGKSWSVIPSPKVGTRDSNLNGVAAVSANDVWAVGLYSDSGARQTLAEHWNGKSWSMVSGPNVGTNDNNFNGVAAVSANDVWAVGLYSQVSGANRTLAEHWNGKSWSVVSSPNPGASMNQLN